MGQKGRLKKRTRKARPHQEHMSGLISAGVSCTFSQGHLIGNRLLMRVGMESATQAKEGGAQLWRHETAAGTTSNLFLVFWPEIRYLHLTQTSVVEIKLYLEPKNHPVQQVYREQE